MKLTEIVNKMNLTVLAGEDRLEKEVKEGHCSDLLSEFVANAGEGCLWLTLQVHVNIVAVALLTGAAGILVTGGREVSAGVCEKAREVGLPVLCTPLKTFEAAGQLYRLIHGSGP